MRNRRFFGSFSVLCGDLSVVYLPSTGAELSHSGHSAGIHRIPGEGAREGFGGAARRGALARGLGIRQLAVGERCRGRICREGSGTATALSAPRCSAVSQPARPTPRPAAPAAAAGRLARQPARWEPPGAGSLRRPRHPVPFAPCPAGLRGSGDRAGQPHSPKRGVAGPCPQPQGISRAHPLRLASLLAEICYLLSPHRELAGQVMSALSVIRSSLILPFWRPKLGCSPPGGAEDALQCPSLFSLRES